MAHFLPTSAKEVEALGWDYIDVILFSGDAYIDHPSFGPAIISRTLEAHGYKREKYNYKAIKPNHDTIVFVCHFGLMSVLLSHVMNCSPYSIWQHVCAAPTSVTTIYTEERCCGEALLRIGSIGDTSHLYNADEPISFAARFCECFTDDTRH